MPHCSPPRSWRSATRNLASVSRLFGRVRRQTSPKHRSMRTMGAASRVVPPSGTVGVLGGGQLGRMLSLAAARLGLKCVVFAPEADSPAFQVCADRVIAAYD